MTAHPAHISDRVIALLLADGWAPRSYPATDRMFWKAYYTDGVFGRSIVTLRIDPTGRWLERVDGWGTVERCADLRDWSDDPAGAVMLVVGED